VKTSHILGPPGQRFCGPSSVIESIHGIAIKRLGLAVIKVHQVVLTRPFASLPSVKKLMTLGI